MAFPDDYVEQTKRSMQSLCDSLFPAELMADMEERAKGDIAGGNNLCALHGTPTTKMLYPSIKWCCDKCAQTLHNAGILGNGFMVFDMRA
jgi:hypothetical protein